MIRYELKKVFASAGGKLAVVLTLLLVLVSCYQAVSGVEWVNEAGEPETGFAAISKLRRAHKEWAGALDETRLESIIRENQRLCATPWPARSRSAHQDQRPYPQGSQEDHRQQEVVFRILLGMQSIQYY